MSGPRPHEYGTRQPGESQWPTDDRDNLWLRDIPDLFQGDSRQIQIAVVTPPPNLTPDQYQRWLVDPEFQYCYPGTPVNLTGAEIKASFQDVYGNVLFAKDSAVVSPVQALVVNGPGGIAQLNVFGTDTTVPMIAYNQWIRYSARAILPAGAGTITICKRKFWLAQALV